MMLWACIAMQAAFGVVIAIIFLCYFIRNDKQWSIVLQTLVGLGGNAGAIFIFDKYFDLQDMLIRMAGIASLLIAFILSMIIGLCIIARLIKDKDNTDMLRIRDIILGQTQWVETYYNGRRREIDERLNIEALNEREQNVLIAEEGLHAKEESFQKMVESTTAYIKEEKDRIKSESKKKAKMLLPEDAQITLTQKHIDIIPSYFRSICMCVNNINVHTQCFLDMQQEDINQLSLKSYFMSVATYISTDIFGGSVADVRVHFRLYSPQTDSYEQFVVIIAGSVPTTIMTPIPYRQDTMINKSHECKRALIKSINGAYDYRVKKYTLWKDYMTYTFQNLQYQDKPCLSFGISIKNEARYKDLLHFLNYCELEYWLQDNIEKLNAQFNLVDILYGGGVVK